MPCYDGRDEPSASFSADLGRAHRKVDKLTAMLCSVCQRLEANKISVPASVHDWWNTHKEFDRKRGARR